jgi:hypothetical protein
MGKNDRFVEHVRAYAKEHNITYMCAISEASKTYQKKPRRPVKKQPVKKQPERPQNENDKRDELVSKIMKKYKIGDIIEYLPYQYMVITGNTNTSIKGDLIEPVINEVRVEMVNHDKIYHYEIRLKNRNKKKEVKIIGPKNLRRFSDAGITQEGNYKSIQASFAEKALGKYINDKTRISYVDVRTKPDEKLSKRDKGIIDDMEFIQGYLLLFINTHQEAMRETAPFSYEVLNGLIFADIEKLIKNKKYEKLHELMEPIFGEGKMSDYLPVELFEDREVMDIGYAIYDETY